MEKPVGHLTPSATVAAGLGARAVLISVSKAAENFAQVSCPEPGSAAMKI
jgi:hypothetical protein